MCPATMPASLQAQPEDSVMRELAFTQHIYIVMAWIVIGGIVMACMHWHSLNTTTTVTAYIIMANIVMSYVVMAHPVVLCMVAVPPCCNVTSMDEALERAREKTL